MMNNSNNNNNSRDDDSTIVSGDGGEYWCHECGSKTVARVRRSDQSVYCSRCNSEFVEQLENDGSLYQTQPSAPPQLEEADEDLMLESAIDNLLSGSNNTATTTTQQQQAPNASIPRASPNLNPMLQQLFNTATNTYSPQDQQQQVPNFGIMIQNMMNSIFNPPSVNNNGDNNNNNNNNNTASAFSINLNDFFRPPTAAATTTMGGDQQQQPHTNFFSFSLNDIFNQLNQGGMQMGDYFLGDNLQQLINQLFDQSGNRGTPPASKRAMDSLPIHKASSEEGHNEKECTICQEHYQDGEDIVTLPCGHLFHKECIWPWLLRHATCPTCRHQLETTDEAPNPDVSRNDASSQPQSSPSTNNNTGTNYRGRPQVFNFSFGPPDFNNGNNNNNSNNNSNGGSGGSNMSYFL